MNNKNYLLMGSLVVAIIAGFLFWQSTQSKTVKTTGSQVITTNIVTQQETPTEALMQKVSVEYTKSGFSPKSITVKAGTTVFFRNSAGKKMWVASDPHPTHQNLAGFDQLASVADGGEYSFTFTKEGSFKYHNHVAPVDGGVVVVQK